MAYPKLAHLVYKLHEKALTGNILWEETATNGVYQASFVDYSIQISTQPSREVDGEEVGVRFSIIDSQGNQVESFLDADLDQKWFKEFGLTDNPYKIMIDTYGIARRSALGAEKAVNDILSELDDVIPF